MFSVIIPLYHIQISIKYSRVITGILNDSYMHSTKWIIESLNPNTCITEYITFHGTTVPLVSHSSVSNVG